jgi:hypothetical protein
LSNLYTLRLFQDPRVTHSIHSSPSEAVAYLEAKGIEVEVDRNEYLYPGERRWAVRSKKTGYALFLIVEDPINDELSMPAGNGYPWVKSKRFTPSTSD